MAMTMKLTKEDIDTSEKREKYTVCVVGCGRVGLLTACLFVDVGFNVIGVDSNRHIVSLLKKYKSPFTEPQLHEFIEKHIKNRRFTATTNARKVAAVSDVIVINAPTRLDNKKKPDYSHIEMTCREVGMGLHSGSLVVFQSVMGPGVTETLAKETLETASGLKAGTDFGLASCPICASSEQILEDVNTCTRVVGAIDQQSLNVASLILGTITNEGIVKVRDIRTAEAVKLFEKAHQDVDVALTNEFAHFCEKAGIDFVEAWSAVSRQPQLCLRVPSIANCYFPKYSYLLVEEAEALNVKLHMLKLVRKINDETLDHTLHLVKDALRSCQKTLRRARIAVFGVSSFPNTKETGGSSTRKLVDTLKKRGALVQVYDPLFSHKELLKMGYPVKATLTKTVEGTDCIIIAVGHDRFRRLNLRRIKIFVKKPAAIVDVGHVIDPAKAEKEGFVYRGLGRGVWTK